MPKDNDLEFAKFSHDHITLYAQWCEEPETKRWLGTPTQEWLDYVLTTDLSWTWIVYDGDLPVGQLQIDPLEDDPTVAQVTILVAPEQRRKGYARRMLNAVHTHNALTQIVRFYARIEHQNAASAALFTSMGYTPDTSEPDEYGYVNYSFCSTTSGQKFMPPA